MKIIDRILLTITYIAALLTFGIAFFLIGYILVKGIPYLTPSLFALTYTSENVSVVPSIVSTIIITFLSLLFALPLGIFTAIYLVEYSKRGSKLIWLIRITAETLSGIPSIIYGLFGLLFFVTYLKLGFSILSGSLTLFIMVLPLIMRTTEEALTSVPDSYREGSLSLGAGNLRTVFTVVLPSAVPGILSGVILAIGRIVGETAALIYTAGTVAQIPTSLGQSARTLSVHMYALSSEGLHTNEAYASAVILLVVVVCVNTLSAFVAKKFASA